VVRHPGISRFCAGVGSAEWPKERSDGAAIAGVGSAEWPKERSDDVVIAKLKDPVPEAKESEGKCDGGDDHDDSDPFVTATNGQLAGKAMQVAKNVKMTLTTLAVTRSKPERLNAASRSSPKPA